MREKYMYAEADHYLRHLNPVLRNGQWHYECSDTCDVFDSKVLDFENNNEEGLREYCTIGRISYGEQGTRNSTCPVVTFLNFSGLFFLPGYLSCEDQLCLANECLRNYVKPPNPCNLDKKSDLRALNEYNRCQDSTWWEPVDVTTQGSPKEYCTRKVEARDIVQCLNKLRWVTLGRHYKWSERCYSDTSAHDSQLPKGLYLLATLIIRHLTDVCRRNGIMHQMGHVGRLEEKGEQMDGAYEGVQSGFSPNAAILNLYSSGDRLGGHVDDAEGVNIDKLTPLVSISLGSPCYFLVSHSSYCNTKPLGIVLRSGDVLVMADKSRLCFHGVPRVFGRLAMGSHLCRKERRRRQPMVRKVERGVLEGYTQFEPTPCFLDDILSLEEQCSDEKEQGFRTLTVQERQAERAGSDRQVLLSTLASMRLNLSIRHAP